MTLRPLAVLPLLLASLALADATTTTTAPASAGRISAKETDTLKAAIGKEATVYGTVVRVNTSSVAKITFIDFNKEKGDFSGVIKKEEREAIDKAFDGDLAKAIKGKEVEITGTITEFKGTPQIEIKKPDQIKVIEKK